MICVYMIRAATQLDGIKRKTESNKTTDTQYTVEREKEFPLLIPLFTRSLSISLYLSVSVYPFPFVLSTG